MKKTAMFFAASVLLVAAAFAGDIEDLAVKNSAMPVVDAGSIWNQVNQHPFPQPTPTTLDTCVFTEFKNNKCYFKCQSGAVLAEPAVKPDFSTGEPAGACATYIIRPIKDPFSFNKSEANWKHINLQAADGTRISIDYSPLSLGSEIIAAPLWVTVSRPGLTGAEKVRAVIMNYYDSSNISANTLYEKQELDLKYNGTAFQLEGSRVELSQSHIGYGYNFRQEIAVVVDGKWLSDPVNGSHNFKFKMNW